MEDGWDDTHGVGGSERTSLENFITILVEVERRSRSAREREGFDEPPPSKQAEEARVT